MRPTHTRGIALLAAAFSAALAAPTSAQVPPASPRSASVPTLVIEDATLEWIDKSEVAALREGVVKSMELQMGMVARKGMPIGFLHDEIAQLNVAKAKLAASGVATKRKAEAQKDYNLSIVARNKRLRSHDSNYVSKEEQDKAEAEVKIAVAAIEEAVEKQKLDQAELELANRILEEHIIRAPFDGVVIERMKSPGETVRANEAVVTLGNLDKLRAFVYVPIEYAFRVKEGAVVDLQPRINGSQGAPLPIEKKRFRGKVTFVDPQIQPVAETAVRVFAEFENKDHELRPGLKAEMTIYLAGDEPAPVAPAPAVGSRAELPPLPR